MNIYQNISKVTEYFIFPYNQCLSGKDNTET